MTNRCNSCSRSSVKIYCDFFEKRWCLCGICIAILADMFKINEGGFWRTVDEKDRILKKFAESETTKNHYKVMAAVGALLNGEIEESLRLSKDLIAKEFIPSNKRKKYTPMMMFLLLDNTVLCNLEPKDVVQRIASKYAAIPEQSARFDKKTDGF